MASSRDSQRGRVYDAEDLVLRVFDGADRNGLRTVTVLGSQLTLPVERRFGSAAAVQHYADRVLGLNWVRAQWNPGSLRVRPRAGQQAAHYETGTATIAVPERGTWALREFVVLHEIAHHLEPAAAHGPAFVSAYLELVDGIIGSEAAFLLRTTLAECGVRFG